MDDKKIYMQIIKFKIGYDNKKITKLFGLCYLYIKNIKLLKLKNIYQSLDITKNNFINRKIVEDIYVNCDYHIKLFKKNLFLIMYRMKNKINFYEDIVDYCQQIISIIKVIQLNIECINDIDNYRYDINKNIKVLK